MAVVALEQLTRRFRGAEGAALDRLELSIHSGELLCLVGPSGCGKSTTLRLVAGLDAPDSGRVLIDGVDVSRTPPQDRDVAMVFQGYALYPHLSVYENIEFPLRMRGATKAERKRKVGDAAALLGLEKLLARRPGELSGGERQRVAMGRAVVRAPKVFLFDEPLSNLDAALRTELRVEIGALVRRLGTTSLYVTHDQIEAMTLGDRIAVLRAGALQQVGAPRAIYEDPDNRFVAGFLGAPPCSFLELAREGDRLRAPGLDLPAPAWLDAARVVAGVRPEHVALAPVGPNDIELTAEVFAKEPLGAETYLSLDVAGQRLSARAPGFLACARGERLTVHLAPSRLLYFDVGGARLREPR